MEEKPERVHPIACALYSREHSRDSTLLRHKVAAVTHTVDTIFWYSSMYSMSLPAKAWGQAKDGEV